MTILRERETWKRERRAKASPGLLLTDEERAHVKTALAFLRTRHGGAEKLAAVMRVRQPLIENVLARRGRPMPAMAIAVARAAQVTVDAILTGAWPPEGMCPHCGRT